MCQFKGVVRGLMISRKSWFFFSLAAIIAIILWYRFTFPQFAFVDLSIDRVHALNIAKKFLKEERRVNIDSYRNAIIFVGAQGSDRYLQKALGFKGEQEFFKKHNYEIFFWKVRFYRENEKEEYLVTISSKTGEITNYSHAIKEMAAYPKQDEETAKKKVVDFLERHFKFSINDYELEGSHSRNYPNRTDYSFSFKKKGVFVKWNPARDTGGATLSRGAAVTGDEIFNFSKDALVVPEEFNRYIARKTNVGSNLAILFRIAFLTLLTASIFYVVVRRNDLVMHSTKRFCLGLTFCVFAIEILDFFNEFQSVLYAYPTTRPFSSFLWQAITGCFLDTFIVTIGILMPCLAGVSLYYEGFPGKKQGSFLHYIQSTFFSRNISQLCVLGYLVAVIMIGIQSVAFEIGQKFLGVWVEYAWMAQLTASSFPFLSAFVLGFVASTTEEIAFRLFSISLGKKFLKKTWLAVLFASIIWGYGHSTYLVFPMWFRGLEVTCLGIFLSWVYLRYGIITVLVAHFLFDVFWSSSAHLLGKSLPYHFYSALMVLLLPLFFAIIAYIKNADEADRPMFWKLNRHQIFNLAVLKEYLRNHPPAPGQSLPALRQEITHHGWDIAVVEMAINDIANKQPSPPQERPS